MPIPFIQSFLAMMPRLAAEEMLDASTAVALGSGTLKDAAGVTARLLRATGDEQQRRAPAPSPAALAAMGIEVVKSNG